MNQVVLSDFRKNRHGHYIVRIKGLPLKGFEEVERLEAAGVRLPDNAKLVFNSTGEDGYNRAHLLEDGRPYNIALIPGAEFTGKFERTPQNIIIRATTKFGYSTPLAGAAPRLREALPDMAMDLLGMIGAAVMHDPMRDGNGGVLRLNPNRGDNDQNGGNWIGCYPAFLDQYDAAERRMFAFFDPVGAED